MSPTPITVGPISPAIKYLWHLLFYFLLFFQVLLLFRKRTTLLATAIDPQNLDTFFVNS